MKAGERTYRFDSKISAPISKPKTELNKIRSLFVVFFELCLGAVIFGWWIIIIL